jgi:hypothetical protein
MAPGPSPPNWFGPESDADRVHVDRAHESSSSMNPEPLLRSPADRLALNQFRELAQAWAPFFRTELRVAVALRDRADKWHLVFGITAFGPEKATPLTALEIRTASIRAYRRIRHFDGTEAIAAVQQTLQRPGVAEFSDVEASLAQPEKQVITFERNFLTRSAGPLRSPALLINKELAGVEASAFPPSEQLDHELLTSEKPFDGLLDLLSELAVPDVNQILSSSRAEIVVLPPALLNFAPLGQALTGGTCLQQGKLNIVVLAHPHVRRNKLRIGTKFFPSTPPIRRDSHVLPQDSWTKREDWIEGRLELAASGVPLALISLSYEGDFLGKWWVRDFDLSFNDRLQIHRSVDQASSLQSTFFDDRTDFEDRVNLLLVLLGLHTLKYGQIPKLTEAPDILALSTARHLYVIECTVGDIDRKGKLHRLYDRANQIREHLSRSPQPPVAVQPAIFTSLTRQETASHWSTAATYRIALVCRENILNLLNVLDSPPTAEQLYSAALAAIPSSGAGE